MVFDTGAEVRIGGRSLVAHFLFEALPNATRPPRDGDNFEAIGEYHGRAGAPAGLPLGGTYACFCNAMSAGWWHRRAAGGSSGMEGGCLWAVRTGLLGVGAHDGPPSLSPSDASALVRLLPAAHRRHPSAAGSERRPLVTSAGSLFLTHATGEISKSDATTTSTTLRADDIFGGPGAVVKEVLRLTPALAPAPKERTVQMRTRLRAAPGGGAPSPATPQAAAAPLVAVSSSASAHGVPRIALRRTVRLTTAGALAANVWQQSAGTPSTTLPDNFDWREVLAGMVPPGEDPLGAQVDQGNCGSCYAFAGIAMLQMRFRVRLFQEHGLLYPLELSYKSPTRCSPYTEGCAGGFSFLISRMASEVGVPRAVCDQAVPAAGLDQTCDWGCYRNASQLFYASDYTHVGGFSHGSDELSIMREIYERGPVELAFSTTAVPEFARRSGHSALNETEVMTVILNHVALKEKYSVNPAVQHWWYSTHAILAVGWGTETVPWGTVKYWIVRNSWGRHWGVNGYAKMRRGNNDGGIENDAAMVEPDMSRLPPGFLAEAKDYHDALAPQRAQWLAQAKVRGGGAVARPSAVDVPEYCKERPDSPDCN